MFHNLRVRLGVVGSIGLSATIALSGCHHQEHQAAHWSYSGEAGPSNWGKLDPEFSLCAAGSCQSPIDLVDAAGQDLPNPVCNYRAGPVGVVNNGHTVQVNCAAGSILMLDGKQYELAQFHFHAPSEHQVAGRSFDAEVHLVHKNAEGKLAVIGVLIRAGADNAALRGLWPHLPAEAGPAKAVDVVFNAADLLPSGRASYRYGGSLTTPPCSEGVSWIVMSTPIEMSTAQLSSLKSIIHTNNRPVQPRNGRPLVLDTTP